MTPKEKAKELVGTFMQYTPAEVEYEFPYAKKCALITVDEIIDAIDWHEYEVPNDQLKFWFKVIKEIEKL